MVKLPPAVRPWVLLPHMEDSVALTGYRGPALCRSAVAAEEWLRLSLPPSLREDERSAKHAKDAFAICVARDYMCLGREGLLVEGMLNRLCETYDAASTSNALLAQLLALEVVCPLAPRSAKFLTPTAVSAETQRETIYVVPACCRRGQAAPTALVMDTPSPYLCTISFRRPPPPPRRRRRRLRRRRWQRGGCDRVQRSRERTARSLHNNAAALRLVVPIAQPLPPHLRARRRRRIAASTAIIRLGLPSIWRRRVWYCRASKNCAAAHYVTHLVAQPVAPCNAHWRISDPRGKGRMCGRDGRRWAGLQHPQIAPVLTVQPAQAEPCTTSTSFTRDCNPSDDHQPSHSGSAARPACFSPWVGGHDKQRYPDVFIVCRAACPDEPLACLLHLHLSRRTLSTFETTPRPVSCYLDHASILLRALHGGSSGGDASTAAATAAINNVFSNEYAIAAATQAAEALPHLLTLSDSLVVVPIVSHASIEPLRHIDPSKGRDWCDLFLLECSLALELHAAGMLNGLSPLLIGRAKPDGSIGRFQLGIDTRRGSSGGSGAAGTAQHPLPDKRSLETYQVLEALAKRLGCSPLTRQHARYAARSISCCDAPGACSGAIACRRRTGRRMAI